MPSKVLNVIALSNRMRVASKHITQLELSKKLNISQSTLSKYLSVSSTTIPSLETIYAFAIECGVSVDWLLSLSENKELFNREKQAIDYIEAFQSLEILLIQGYIFFDTNNYNDYIRDPIFHHLTKIAFCVRPINIEMYNDWKRFTLSKYRGKTLINLPKDECLRICNTINNSFTDKDLMALYDGLSQAINSTNKKDGHFK